MSCRRSLTTQAFRLLSGILGWTAILVQLAVTLTLPTGPSALARTINFFSYFTVLSNIMVATTLVAPELAARSRTGRFLLRYEVRTALVVFMIVTCGVYAVLLAGLEPQTPVQHIADVALHYVMPPLYLCDWLFIKPLRRMNWKSALHFIVFPILYSIYTLIRGALTGTYPYSFLDVIKLGYPAVFINIGLFAILFLGLSILLIAVARWRAK